MSATRRTKAERAENHDYYRTPSWCVRAIAEHLPQLQFGVNAPVFDPCAGDGAILDAFCDADDEPPHPKYGRQSERHLGGIELQADLAAKIRPSTYAHNEVSPCVVTVRDALSPEPWGARGHVVMNPPFSHAEAFVRRAIAEVAPHGGRVFALLRLSFLESADRAALHLEYPSRVYVLPRRPSFCLAVRCIDKACGFRAQLPVDGAKPKKCPECSGYLASSATDASAYAWFEWGPKALGQWTILNVDEPTAERTPWGALLLDGAYLHQGFCIRVPSAYPDGSKVLDNDMHELATMAVQDLGLEMHIKHRIVAGIPGEDLQRVYGRRIEDRLVSMLQSGFRPSRVAEAAKAPAKKTRAKKAKTVEADPEIGGSPMPSQPEPEPIRVGQSFAYTYRSAYQKAPPTFMCRREPDTEEGMRVTCLSTSTEHPPHEPYTFTAESAWWAERGLVPATEAP